LLRSQLALFGTQGSVADVIGRVENNRLNVKDATFKGGLASRVHRWFRLTPSFGPDLVNKMLADMNTPRGAVVLDPFAGAGTTLIEAKLEGHKAVGFEINPLLHFVCKTSLEWELDTHDLQGSLAQIRQRFTHRRASAKGKSLEELGHSAPPIHNVYRWWRRDVLVDLLVLLDSIRSCCDGPKYTQFFEIALAGVLVPDLTNVTLGRLQLHFIDRSTHEIEVWNTFEAHVVRMIADLEDVQQLVGVGDAEVYNADSLSPPVNGVPAVDRVITSPPYPNRYSYVWNTRPHLYLLGFFRTAKDSSELDLKTVGGTWGSATSILSKGKIEPVLQVVEREVMPLAEEIRKRDNLMANYVVKYFNALARQITSQDRLLKQGAALAYVVGCSRIKDVYIETDVLLAKIFEGVGLGYRVRRIERFRRRHSGKDLHESTVYVVKS
jgi:hypothetical protein